MKRIYLLLLLITAASGAYAQRTVDLSVTAKMGTTTTNKVPIQTGQTIIADTGVKGSQFYYGWDVKNNSSTDSLKPGDTLFIKTAYSGSKVRFVFTTGTSLKAGKTISIFPVDNNGQELKIHLSPATASVATNINNSYQWCDSVWVVNGPNTAINDPQNNNRSCVTVQRIIHAMDVNDLTQDIQSLSLYPNPAQGQINMKYNFGNNASATIYVRDVTGKIVYSNTLGKGITGTQEYKLDISTLHSGLYIFEMHCNDQKVLNKFIVQ